MQIRTVQSRQELNAFIDLPYTLYKNNPYWVPPLRDEQYGQFDPARNPMLQHCEWKLFLLEQDGQTIGRIAAFIDNLANEFWQQPIGLFGYLEFIENPLAGELLLQTAHNWLRSRDMQSMRGPWTFVSQEWGMVIEGYDEPPVVMAPYNPPYYNECLLKFGMQKMKDLLCWEVDAAKGYDIPPRILQLTDEVAKRYKVRVRQMDMHRFNDEVQLIETLSNASIINNWGYSPVTPAEVQATARDLKPVIQPNGVLFAETEAGKPIGFAIAIPDINHLLKGLAGTLLPFGWLKLLWGIPRLNRYRMFALGVIPEFQGKAIDSLLYRALYESLYSSQFWMEINYVLEDNWPMINAIKKLGATPTKKYRVYEVQIPKT